jgi:hypothetical protein
MMLFKTTAANEIPVPQLLINLDNAHRLLKKGFERHRLLTSFMLRN